MIRLAEPDDLPGIVEIFNAAIATRIAVAYSEPVTVRERTPWFDTHSAERHPIYVAIDDLGIAGWLSIEPYSERPAYASTAEISIYVRSDTLRRGFGAMLLAHAIDRAPILGIRCLIARMFGTNAASSTFFTRHEFERWGCLPAIGTIDGESRDLVIYGRHLR